MVREQGRSLVPRNREHSGLKHGESDGSCFVDDGPAKSRREDLSREKARARQSSAPYENPERREKRCASPI